jgi:tRNA dimethylallyltransferase
MRRTFFIVGPTATGKSELAADVAREIGAEIVSADAFQIYRGLDLLTAKPDASTLAKAPHHLVGTTPLHEETNAEKYRRAASRAIDEIHSRGKLAIVVGGSGLYIKALTHGLTSLPPADLELRAELNQRSTDDLRALLVDLDPETARKIDTKNRRRLIRALEICLLTDEPASAKRRQWTVAASLRAKDLECADMSALSKRRHVAALPKPVGSEAHTGVFVYRDREELYARINQRVEAMFENGVVEEVRAAEPMSSTASQMIGLHEIRHLLDGKVSISQCIAAIQRATRRYAKRQLTWFRRQTNFQPLNLSLLSHNEARILLRKHSEPRKASGFAHRDD